MCYVLNYSVQSRVSGTAMSCRYIQVFALRLNGAPTECDSRSLAALISHCQLVLLLLLLTLDRRRWP